MLGNVVVPFSIDGGVHAGSMGFTADLFWGISAGVNGLAGWGNAKRQLDRLTNSPMTSIIETILFISFS
jgi:hypothetical protein